MSLADELAAIIRPIVQAAVRDALASTPQPAPANDTLPEYLTFARAAALCEVSPKTVAGWVRQGLLPRHGPKGAERVRLDEFRAFMASRGAEVDEDADRVRHLQTKLAR